MVFVDARMKRLVVATVSMFWDTDACSASTQSMDSNKALATTITSIGEMGHLYDLLNDSSFSVCSSHHPEKSWPDDLSYS